ncbi:MAG: AAA family ATPase [Desulfobacteraceae bacterium]
MKILRLDLLAFGPFTDVSLDLSSGSEGLHLIYGPNEAGKTSALRALRQVLYGIPARSDDAFIHPYQKMRIGALLRHSDGSIIHVIRRKGNANTLRDAEAGKPVDEAYFQKFLGNIDLDVFTTVFGIGHQGLVQGGEEIIRGGGDVGRALFAAGAGISGLRKVQAQLQAEAEALFTPNASTRKINKAISEFKEKRKFLHRAELEGREWERGQNELREALERRESLDNELRAKEAEQNRQERIRDALPLISKRQERLQELSACKGAVLLPEDFGERRHQALAELRIAEGVREQGIKDLEETIHAMEELEVDEALLSREGVIEDCYKDLGGIQKATKDRRGLQSAMELLRAEAGDILSGLRDDLGLDQAERLKLKRRERVWIQELGKEYERIMERLGGARTLVSKAQIRLDAVVDRLDACGRPADVTELEQALEKASNKAALEDHYREETAEIQGALHSLELALKRQTLWRGNLEDLERLPIPSRAAIDEFDQRLAQADKNAADLRAECAELEEDMARIARRLEELDLRGGVPEEKDLYQARRLREEAWGLVRRALEGDPPSDREISPFIEAEPPAKSLAEVYEARVRRTDDLADRLRREADRVAEKAKLTSDQEACRTRLKRAKDRLEAAERYRDEVRGSWERLWIPAGISPLGPREMRAWVQDQEGILERYSNLRERTRKAEVLGSEMEACRKELCRRLRALSLGPQEDPGSLTELAAECRRVIERQRALRTEMEGLLGEKKRKQEELKEAQADLKRFEGELSAWYKRWEEALSPLGLDPGTLPGQAAAVMEDLAVFFDKLKEAESLGKRIQAIDRDAEAYRARVSTLLSDTAPDLAGFPTDIAISELHARLNRAREAGSQLERLRKLRAEQEDKLHKADERIRETGSVLAAMCEEAGCTEFGELAEAERRSSQRRRVEADIESLEEQLHRLSAGAPIEDFASEALAVDPDEIEGEISRLAEEISALRKERTELDREIGRMRTEFEGMDGGSSAARAAEESQTVLASLERNVEAYARVRLASAVLARAVERYRQKHQDPIMKRTNQLFARLTLGRFEGVRAEYEEKAAPVLVGVRPGGRELVPVSGMSDGTADQLFLALRLASLEAYLEGNEPMPFVVDDILIRFDDQRARAALEILSELSTKTQVVFFTHHRHLVDLAEEAAKPDLLFRHTLQLRV